MTEKYPYLNSVIFDSPKLPNGQIEIERNSEMYQNFSSSSSVFNIDERFQEVDLNGCSENSSESPINSDKCIWKLGTDSMELISETNVTSTAQNSDIFLSSFPNNVFNCSSISSLSSITSNNDLSNPVNSCHKEMAKPTNLFDKVDIKTNNRISVVNNKETKTNIFSHISQLIFNRPHKLSKSSSETPLKSTTCLILNDRPLGLPPKSTDEIKRHQDEYNQLISNIKKKEKQQNHANRALLKSKIYQEERQYQLTHVWRNFILPNWFHQQTSQYVRHLWWEGIPSSVRDKVWRQCIPNTLKLTKTHYDNFLSQMQERIERYLEPVSQDDLATKATDKPNTEIDLNNRNGTHISPTVESKSSAAYDLYFTETVSIHNKRSSSLSYSSNVGSSKQSASSDVDIRQILLNTIKLDVSRTFPHLNLFQDGGPHHDLLYQLLGAYACYRPDIGYVQGMSFLAAVLILVMNVEDAFICFANILELPCHHAFYALDESEFTVYLESFKLLLFTHLPQLAQHFIQHKLDVNIFLCDWLFTIYSRALPLETALRVWDIFCRDGEATLFRAGLGILRCYEMQLLNSDFEELAGFLTGQMPESLTASVLVDEMREIKLYASNFSSTIEEVRTRLLKEKVS